MTYFRRQDSSIGFEAPVHANMRAGGTTNTAITSSLLVSMRAELVALVKNICILLPFDGFFHLVNH